MELSVFLMLLFDVALHLSTLKDPCSLSTVLLLSNPSIVKQQAQLAHEAVAISTIERLFNSKR